MPNIATMDIISKIITAEVLYFLAIIFGMWLSHHGKPFNRFMLFIHILIGLGTVVFSSLVMVELLQTRVITIQLLILVISLCLLIIGLIGSGIVLSLDKDNDNKVLGTHNITTVLGIIATTLTIFLLVNEKI